MDIGGIASAASAEELDTFPLRSFRKAFKRASWNLNGLHLVGKLRQLSEAGDCFRSTEGGRLCRDGNSDRFAHLSNDRHHSIWFLLAIDANDGGAGIHHSSRTVGWSVSIGTEVHSWTESHGSQNRKLAVSTALNRDQHLLEMKEGFKNQEINSSVGEQTNLLGNQIANVVCCQSAFTLEKLCPRDRACDQRIASGHFPRDANSRGVDGFGLRAVTGSIQFLAGPEKGERLQHLRACIKKLAVQLPQRVGMLDGDFGSELATAFTRSDLFAARAAVHPATALQFDEIAAVAQDDTPFRDFIEYVFSSSHMSNLPQSFAAIRK